MNFQLLPNGSYDYIHVGDWNNGSLVVWEELQYAHNQPGEKVESVCSKPCAPGYYRVSSILNFFRSWQGFAYAVVSRINSFP